ncbi:MAG TPA: hypothetical protein VMC02_10470 [Steroidobacteraceae bacterium]|nr:hypothetical protein [Steroidobacteraceae bacterium]
MTATGGLRPVRAGLCLGLLLGVPWQLAAVRAAEPPAKAVEPADENLIEFLGSVDSDDEGWRQYLARTGAQRPAAKKPPPPPPSSAPGKADANDEH